MGDLAYPTDSPYHLRCAVAGTWTYYYPPVPATPMVRPPAAGWTWDDPSAVSVASHVGGAIKFTRPHNAQWGSIYYRDAPGATFSAIGLIDQLSMGKTDLISGLALYEKGTRKLIYIGGTGAGGIVVNKWTNVATFSTSLVVAFGAADMRYKWYRVRLNATTIYFDLSPDKVTWDTVGSEAKATFFTTAPDAIGVMIAANNGGPPNLSTVAWLPSYESA